MNINNKIDKNILNDNNINNEVINEKNKDGIKDNSKLEQDFQKEIDKKIKNEHKKEQKESKNNEPNDLKEQISDKSKTKDLTDLKLFVLPYINKDLLSINLKQSLNLDDKNPSFNKQNLNELNNFKQDNLIKKDPQLIQTTKKIDNLKEDYINFNPFEKFEKLYNSLKEISKEEKIKESKIIQQLVENIDIKQLETKRMVEIDVNKEIFGNLKVHIINEDNKVIVVFKTDSKHTLDLLKNNVNELKQMLKNRNLYLDNIKIEYEE
ncbi:MAG: flagellar hook-length control protein FliK [bacterium]